MNVNTFFKKFFFNFRYRKLENIKKFKQIKANFKKKRHPLLRHSLCKCGNLVMYIFFFVIGAFFFQDKPVQFDFFQTKSKAETGEEENEWSVRAGDDDEEVEGLKIPQVRNNNRRPV